MTVSLTAFVLTFACGLVFAVLDLLRKTISLKVEPVLLLMWMVAGHVPFFALWVALDETATLTNAYWLPGIASVIVQIIGNLLFLFGVSRSPLSLTIPVLSLTPVFTTMFGAVILGEVPSAQQLGGIVLIVIGLVWLYMPPGGGFALLRSFSRFAREPGARFMLGAALLWSLAAPIDKLGVQASSPSVHALFQLSGMALTLFLWLAATRGLSALKVDGRSGVLLGLAALCGAVAFGLQLAAFAITFVAFVEALKRVVGQFAALFFGAIFFAEPITRPKVYGMLLMSTGIPLLALPNLL